MGAFIAKQPNGLYCRFSSIVDCPTHWNMTEQDYIDMCVEKAKEEARDTLNNYLYPFEWVKQRYMPNNMKRKEFKKFLEETSKPVHKCLICGQSFNELKDHSCPEDSTLKIQNNQED